MFGKVDARLGQELGLTGQYAALPAFQIVNDAHDLVAGLTSRIVTLEYGAERERFRHAPSWEEIKNQRARFVQRVKGLDADAVKAAELSDEIEVFIVETLDPFIAACAGSAP